MTVREELEKKYGKPKMSVRQELEQKYGTKNPEAPKEEGTITKIGKFFAEPFVKTAATVKDVAKGIGSLGAVGLAKVSGNKEYEERALKQLSEVGQPTEVLGYGKVEPIKSIPEAVKTSAEIASYATPFAKAKTLGQVAKLGALAPTVSGAAEKAQETDDIAEVIKSGVSRGAIGAGTASALYGVGKAIQWTLEKAPKSIYEGAIGATKKYTEKGKSPAEYMMQMGQIGTKDDLININQKIIDDSEKTLESTLLEKTSPIKISDVQTKINNYFKNKYGNTLSPQQISELSNSVPLYSLEKQAKYDYISPLKLNKIRAEFARNFIRNGSWLKDNTGKIDDYKSVYGIVSDAIKRSDKTGKATGLFNDISKSLTAVQILNRANQTDVGAMAKLMGALKIGATAAVGGVSGIVPAAATYGALEVAGSTPTQTGLAVGLKRLGEKTLTPVVRKSIGEGLQKLSNIRITR